MGVKRNYQFLQFLLDLFSLFMVYLILACVLDVFKLANAINTDMIRASGGEAAKVVPTPIVIWGILALVVLACGVILPFWFIKRTKLNQKQFNMWVYAVYLVRILSLLIVFYGLDIHASFIVREPKSVIDFSVITSFVLIAILIKVTQIRIRAAEPKKLQEKREFVED